MTARLAVHVQPQARQPGVRGRGGDGVLRVAVASPPADGRANRELEERLARVLAVPRASVTVIHGGSTRRKLVEIEGIERDELERRLEVALARVEDDRDE